MILSSFAVLALSASAAVSPFSNLVHMHPHAARNDGRCSITLYNNASGFRDVKVSGQVYTVEPKHLLTIKAPAGTMVYADSRTPTMKRGDLVVEVSAAVDNTRVVLN